MTGMLRFPKRAIAGGPQLGGPGRRAAASQRLGGGSPSITSTDTRALPVTRTTDTGYPWADGEILYAPDLNTAFANSAVIAGGPFLPLSGGTVTGQANIHNDVVFTPATTQAGMIIYGNMSGTMGAVGGVSPFTLTIPANSVDSTSNPGSSFYAGLIQHNFGGTKGGQGSLNVTMTQTADVADTGSFFINPLAVYLDIEHSGNSLGNALPLSAVLHYGPAATGWATAAAEMGISREAGSTVLKSIGLNLTFTNYATTHATQWETGLCFSGTPGMATGLNSLISIGHGITQWILDRTNGWVFTTYPQTNNNPGGTQRWAQACAGGLDFSKINFTTAALWAPGIAIGAGPQHATIGGTQISTDASGLVLDGLGTQAWVSGIGTAGTGYKAGDQLYDGVGGIMLVSTVGGPGNITAIAYIAGKEPYNFGSPPASVTPSGGSGSGAIINIGWSARQQITINKSGAPVVLGGTLTGPEGIFNYLAVGSAAGPTITTGVGVPAGTQPSGSIYLRTAGAAGARLYVTSGGGTWAAVASV